MNTVADVFMFGVFGSAGDVSPLHLSELLDRRAPDPASGGGRLGLDGQLHGPHLEHSQLGLQRGFPRAERVR